MAYIQDDMDFLKGQIKEIYTDELIDQYNMIQGELKTRGVLV